MIHWRRSSCVPPVAVGVRMPVDARGVEPDRVWRLVAVSSPWVRVWNGWLLKDGSLCCFDRGKPRVRAISAVCQHALALVDTRKMRLGVHEEHRSFLALHVLGARHGGWPVARGCRANRPLTLQIVESDPHRSSLHCAGCRCRSRLPG